MKHPFESLPAATLRRVYGLFFVLTLGVTLLLGALNQYHPEGAAPTDPPRTVPIIQLEFLRTAAQWEQAVAPLGAPGVAALRQTTYADFLYLFCYSTLLAAGVIGVTRAVKSHRVRLFARWLAWGQWLAGLLDGIENYGILHNAAGSPSDLWALTSAYCATVKFALVIVGTLYVLVMLAQSWRDEA